MTDDDVMYGETFDEIDLFATNNATELTGRTDILKYLGQCADLNIEYKRLGNKQTVVITGSAKDKKTARNNFQTLILNISRPLAGYFYDNNNMEMFDQVNCKIGLLSNLRDTELLSRGENLSTICTENPLALAACNILPAKITAYNAAKLTFSGLCIIPRDKIKGRADTGKLLRITRDNIVAIINNKLTNAMYAFEGVNDPLLAIYLNIIKLVHTGVRHRKSEIATTFQSFQLYSATTNEKISRGILQVFELPKTITSRVGGSFKNVEVILGSCTIQASAFGFVNYSAIHVFTKNNTEVIAIYMTPIA